MSGIETAGIVLGAIPLVISALEHYAEGISTIHKWWRYKRELASLKRILDAEYVRYLNTCEELLSGIVPDATLATLLDFPGGPGWQDPDIERKLHSRLRTSFTSYLNTVTDMNDIMEILKSKLELDPNGKVSFASGILICASRLSAHTSSWQLRWNDVDKFRREYKRIKFSLTKSSYEELMKRIEKDNDTLANLTGQSLRLEPTRLRRSNRTTDFDRIRSQADSLYRVLKKNWCCSCQTPHNASLRLEARTSGNSGSFDTESERMRFRMLFSFDIDPSFAHSVPWQPKETEIEPLEVTEDDMDPSKVSLASLAGLSVTSTTLSPSQSLAPRPKLGVRWASDTPEGSSSSTLAIRKSRSAESITVQIQNLCSAFKDWKGTEECMGFLADEQSMRHGVYPVLRAIHQETPKMVTLYKRLDTPHVPNAKLTRR
jgi:hypothetical protein